MVKIFFSYSHEDEQLRNELEAHLAMLKRQGLVEFWHDRRIAAGNDLVGEISDHLEEADIVLLLVSPDFLNSDYCYDIEMQRALEKHRQGEARVIPIILRHCDWHPAPFGKLLALPTDGKPVVKFPDRDEAFFYVVQGIRKAAEELMGTIGEETTTPQPRKVAPARPADDGPRSSNLRIKKEFSDREKDRFLQESFEFIARFFENSLSELSQRNPEIESEFNRIDARTFVATFYNGGKKISRCSIWLQGERLGGDIAFSFGEPRGGMNETLSVKPDEHSIYLEAMGMQSFCAMRDKLLTQEGGAEHLWGLFISRLQ